MDEFKLSSGMFLSCRGMGGSSTSPSRIVGFCIPMRRELESSFLLREPTLRRVKTLQWVASGALLLLNTPLPYTGNENRLWQARRNDENRKRYTLFCEKSSRVGRNWDDADVWTITVPRAAAESEEITTNHFLLGQLIDPSHSLRAFVHVGKPPGNRSNCRVH